MLLYILNCNTNRSQIEAHIEEAIVFLFLILGFKL